MNSVVVFLIICLLSLITIKNDFIKASIVNENDYLNVASNINTLQEKKEFIKNNMLIESKTRLSDLENSYFTKQSEIYFLNASISSLSEDEKVKAEQHIKKAEAQLLTISSTSNELKFKIKLSSLAIQNLEEKIASLFKQVNPSPLRFAANGMVDGLLMIKENSEIYGIGNNVDGNLGCGNNINPMTTPCKVIDTGVLKGKAILQIKSQRHTVILTTDNLLISFGYAQSLGDGKGSSSNVPVFVQNSFFIDKQIKQLEVGQDNTLVMTTDGNVYGWGRNVQGDLCSTGSKATPTLIAPPTGKKFKKIFYQMITSVFLMEDGDVYYCGTNLNTAFVFSLTKMDVKAIDQTIDPIEDIIAGDRIIIYRTKSGNLYSQGYGGHYTLGFGDSNTKNDPTLIPYFSSAGISIAKVCTGYKHVVALSTDGRVYQWGINPATGLQMTVPSRFSGNEIENYKIVDISCGGFINVAVSEDNVVFGWGKGYLFGLGSSMVPAPTKLTLP